MINHVIVKNFLAPGYYYYLASLATLHSSFCSLFSKPIPVVLSSRFPFAPPGRG
jgi:hypothetical protein